MHPGQKGRYFIWESAPPGLEGFVWQNVTIHRSSAVLSGCGCWEGWPVCVVYDRLNMDRRGNLFVSDVTAVNAEV
jgi:hypothetical protein